MSEVVRIRPRREELIVAAGMLGAQVGVYALTVACSRILGTDKYGELAALLTITLIAAVPAFALQALVARTCAAAIQAGQSAREAAAGLVRLTVATTIGTSLTAGLLTLVLAHPLRTDLGTAILATTLEVIPLAALSLAQGLLQGQAILPKLSLLLFVAGSGRLLGGLVPLIVCPKPWVVLLGIGVGTAMATVLGLFLARIPGSIGPDLDWRPLARVSAATGAMWLFSNVDVVAARIALSDHDAGLYAAISLTAKAMFWAPQFIAVSAFARMTDPTRTGQVLREAFAKVAAIGAVGVVVAAVTGPFILPRMFTSEYDGVKNLAPLFVALGAVMALVQLLVMQRIARHDEVITTVVWIAGLVDLGLVVVWLHGSVVQVGACGLSLAVVLVAMLTARALTKN